MSIELIRNQRDKNSAELYATPPNEKCPIGKIAQKPGVNYGILNCYFLSIICTSVSVISDFFCRQWIFSPPKISVSGLQIYSITITDYTCSSNGYFLYYFSINTQRILKKKKKKMERFRNTVDLCWGLQDTFHSGNIWRPWTRVTPFHIRHRNSFSEIGISFVFIYDSYDTGFGGRFLWRFSSFAYNFGSFSRISNDDHWT